MKCMYCEAQMERGTVPYHIDRTGIHIILDAVPSWVCPQCGEFYFESKEVESLQEMVRAVEEKSRYLAETA